MGQLQQNLKFLMDKRGANPTSLAKATGVPQPTIHRILAGESKDPRTLTIKPLADFFGVMVEALRSAPLERWDLEHKHAPLDDDLGYLDQLSDDFVLAPDGTVTSSHRHRPRRDRIPVVGTARLGDNGYYEEISSLPGAGDGLLEVPSNDPNAYGLRVKGQSMFPAIRDGWYVAIEPNGTPQEGEYVLAIAKDGRKMVKEFLFRRSGSIELLSVNSAERITLDLADLQALHPVAAVVPPSKWSPE